MTFVEKWSEVLGSTRFQAAVAAIGVYYLKSRYGLDPILADGIIALLATHIGIKTVDTVSKNVGGRK